MSTNLKSKMNGRKRRHRRVRKRVFGTPDRYRLSVFRSNRFLYGQVIDDVAGRTVASASTAEPAIQKQGKGLTMAAAKAVGAALAERAKAASVGAVVFDRGGYLYHGRIKALADAAREAGLNF